jgi:predicted nucleic acid-binding protein
MLLFDASTLILLAKAELLDNFLDDFPENAVITKGVQEECCRKEQAMDSLLIKRAINDKKILVKTLKSRTIYQKLRADLGLGSGEAETLALALPLKTRLVAIDDRRGIKACKLLKISFVTAIDIVVRLNEKRVLTKEQAIAKVDALKRYGRYSEEILIRAKQSLEAKK